MKKEQFFTELKGRGFEFLDMSETEHGFKDDLLNMAYEMWSAGLDHQKQTIESLKAQLAQYQSDDYVLVPKVPSEVVKDQLNEIIAESIFVETSWGGVNSAQFECGTDEVIYKAMIEAQEQHNAKP